MGHVTSQFIKIKEDGVLSLRNFAIVFKKRTMKGSEVIKYNLRYVVHCRGIETLVKDGTLPKGVCYRIDKQMNGNNLKETLTEIGQVWVDMHKEYYDLDTDDINLFLTEIVSEPVINAFQSLMLLKLKKKAISVQDLDSVLYTYGYKGYAFSYNFLTIDRALDGLQFYYQFANTDGSLTSSGKLLKNPNDLIQTIEVIVSQLKAKSKTVVQDPSALTQIKKDLGEYLASRKLVLELRYLYDDKLEAYIDQLKNS